ncbi:hypothetical protein NMEN98008_0894 [Neisseria meningitidis 98008]|nr:hypothetical protein [Neisseria meningitidis]EJU67639.1 hypothetical protein NMEN98008_0894 [Neisseria meningitidis 98008]
MPTPPAALMVAPVRPNPPKDGKTVTLLEHAAEFGGYVAELENQNQAWRDWRAITPAKSETAKKARVGRGLRVKADFIPLLQG